MCLRRRNVPPPKKYTSAVEIYLRPRNMPPPDLRGRNEPFAWKQTFSVEMKRNSFNEAPFRNKHFPLPLPGTHHLFPPAAKKNCLAPYWKARRTWEQALKSRWVFTAISCYNLHDGQRLWHLWWNSRPNLLVKSTCSCNFFTASFNLWENSTSFSVHVPSSSEACSSQDSSSVPMNSCSPSLSSSPTGSTQT